MSVLHFQSLRTAGSWAYDALWLWKCKSRAFKDNCWVRKTRYDLFQRGSRVFLHCFWGFPLVQLSCSDMSDSLQHHEPQHARPLCPSPAPRICPNSCPLSRWCHLTISFSVIPFNSCLQSFPTSESFQMSQLFTSGGQNIGFSFNTSPYNEHPGLISFRMDWLDLLAVQGTLKSLLQHHSSKAPILQCSAFFIIQLSHPY